MSAEDTDTVNEELADMVAGSKNVESIKTDNQALE